MFTSKAVQAIARTGRSVSFLLLLDLLMLVVSKYRTKYLLMVVCDKRETTLLLIIYERLTIHSSIFVFLSLSPSYCK